MKEYSEEYIEELVKRDTVMKPVKDPVTKRAKGGPVARCVSCGFILSFGIEQFCPCCGQRFVETD